MTGGGLMIYVDSDYPTVQLIYAVTTNNAFNICAVLLGRRCSKVLIMVVYRVPWANNDDTKDLCKHLEDISAHRADHVIVVDDFNLPHMTWHDTIRSLDISIELHLRCFVNEHSLAQIVLQPSHHNALINLIFVSPSLESSFVTDLPPIASSDHNA